MVRVSVWARIVVLVVVLGTATACMDDDVRVPDDPTPVTVVEGQTTTMNLGGGAYLIIPPGAAADGATIRASYKDGPAGDAPSMRLLGHPVELVSEPPDAIHGLLTLEFPVPADLAASDPADLASAVGIATYDSDARIWVPVPTSFDQARKMIVAQIPHFSWYNPFSWDWDGFFARIAQDFGELTGARTGPASCTSGPPSWVNFFAGVTNDANFAIRSCGQSEGDVLDVQLVNNRPYGMIMTYGSPVKWGWHENGRSALDKWRNAQMDKMVARNQLYLPPLSRASVGILKLPRGKLAKFHIGPTNQTAGMDLATYLLDKSIGEAPRIGDCLGLASRPLTGLDVGALRDYATWAMGCAVNGYKIAVRAGALDAWTADRAANLLGKLHGARLVSKGIEIAGGSAWRIGDLFFDSITNSGDLGHGFSVLAKANVTEPQPPPEPPAVSKPTLSDFAATVVGSGQVGVSFKVGWQSGRDPVTCHFFIDGHEAYKAQCGTSSSKQFTGLIAGDHSFSATVTDRFGVSSDPSPTLVRTVPGNPPPPADPKPTVTNFIVVIYGGGHVGVAYDVAWQSGRDPITCHFFIDGHEAFTAQCGTHSSKQFYGISAGQHSFYATVSDHYGVYSDPTPTIVRQVT